MWMAIYDPSFSFAQMMAEGQLYTAQIDANSHTVVNIGLLYHTYVNRTSSYGYGKHSERDSKTCLLGNLTQVIDVKISTRQNLDLVCDLTKENWYLCHLTIEMQIPSFLRTSVREERRQDWTVSTS
jgi:hypothetical protein